MAWLSHEGGLESAAAFLVLDALAELAAPGARSQEARRLAERLAFERKLREALRNSGIMGDRAWKGTALAKVLAGTEGVATAKKAGKAPAARVGGKDAQKSVPESSGRGLLAIFASLGDDEEMQGLVGVNVWEGTSWFNKESFDELLDFAALATVIRGGVVRKAMKAGRAAARAALLSAKAELGERGNEIGEELRALRRAEVDSGYRLDEFERALRQGESSAQPAVKAPTKAKPGAQKKPSGKTAADGGS